MIPDSRFVTSISGSPVGIGPTRGLHRNIQVLLGHSDVCATMITTHTITTLTLKKKKLPPSSDPHPHSTVCPGQNLKHGMGRAGGLYDAPAVSRGGWRGAQVRLRRKNPGIPWGTSIEGEGHRGGGDQWTAGWRWFRVSGPWTSFRALCPDSDDPAAYGFVC